MVFNQNPRRRIILLLVMAVPWLFSLWTCGDGINAKKDSDSGTGTLAFHVVFHGFVDSLQSREAVIDCEGLSVASVEAVVYTSNDVFVADGGPWDCIDGRGTITSVPAGSGRIIVILGKDSDGNIVFRGRKRDIAVIANGVNDAGTVECYAFVPKLKYPNDRSVVDVNALDLEWNNLAGAFDFGVVVSEASDLSDPVIDKITGVLNYLPSGLSNAKTYYWHVYAVDSDGNRSAGSDIWSFNGLDTFVPSLKEPANGAEVAVGTVELEWNEVAGAVAYRVVVKKSADLNNPIIDETTTDSNYSLSVLSYDETYSWQVFAIDAYDNAGPGSEIRSLNTQPQAIVKLVIGNNASDDFRGRFFVGQIKEGYHYDYPSSDIILIGDSYGRVTPPECETPEENWGDNPSGAMIIDTIDLANHTIADQGDSDVRLKLYIDQSHTSGIVELYSLVDQPTIPGVTGCCASDSNSDGICEIAWSFPKTDTKLATVNVSYNSTGYVEFSSAKLDEYMMINKGRKLYLLIRKPDGIYQIHFRSPDHSADNSRPCMEVDTIQQQ